MTDLRVLFAAATDTGYRAQLADAKGHRLGVEVPFKPFLTEADYEDLRWDLEEYMDLPDGGAVIRAQRIEREFGELGCKLHEAPESRVLLSKLLAGSESSRLTISKTRRCCGGLGSSWPKWCISEMEMTRFGVSGPTYPRVVRLHAVKGLYIV